MFARLRTFPPQIWLLFAGTLLSSTGQALVWPFLTFIREQLDIPSPITLLFTLQAIAGCCYRAGQPADGPLWPQVADGDRAGMSSTVLVMMSQAATYPQALLLPLYGVVNTIFRIGSYAMVADMVPPSAGRRCTLCCAWATTWGRGRAGAGRVPGGGAYEWTYFSRRASR